MTLPTPPVDGAASKIVLEYLLNGQRRHIALHTQQVDTGAPTSRGTPANPDWSYTNSESFLGITFATTELGFQDTVTQFLGHGVKAMFPSAVNFAIKANFANSGGGLTELFPTAALGAEAGTNTTAMYSASDLANDTYSILTARSTNGGRFRLQIVGAALAVNGAPDLPQQPQSISPSTSGNNWQKLVAYLLSDSSRVLCHDGGRPTGSFVLHIGQAARMRRSTGF